MTNLFKIGATILVLLIMWFFIVMIETPPPRWDNRFKKVNTAMFLSGTGCIIAIWMLP